jgi:Asp-tRNA(Asn)/Glu-tRNA(Gln) amidotransferase A subunit family amidase
MAQIEGAAPGHGGLPIGMQLIGPAWQEDVLLRIARMLERALQSQDKASHGENR